MEKLRKRISQCNLHIFHVHALPPVFLASGEGIAGAATGAVMPDAIAGPPPAVAIIERSLSDCGILNGAEPNGSSGMFGGMLDSGVLVAVVPADNFVMPKRKPIELSWGKNDKLKKLTSLTATVSNLIKFRLNYMILSHLTEWLILEEWIPGGNVIRQAFAMLRLWAV